MRQQEGDPEKFRDLCDLREEIFCSQECKPQNLFTAMLSNWNTQKLGPNPGLERLHDMYMKYVTRRKATVPTVDASDPMPYLAEQRARRARQLETGKVEILGNYAFQKVRG